MKKLTRQAQLLVFIIILLIFFALGFLLLKNNQPEEKPATSQYQIQVVAENQKIVSTYIDSISNTNSDKVYKECAVQIKKGTKVLGYTLSQDQSFGKYLKLEGPDDKEILTKKSNQKITHYAYTLLLTGDIIEKQNLQTKDKTYEITNARVTYDCIPLVLLSNENSVCLRNKTKTKEKIVNLQDFIDALKDLKKRNQMISW